VVDLQLGMRRRDAEERFLDDVRRLIDELLDERSRS
jgi:hypothetical protein